MEPEIGQPLASTAYWTAAVRALETRRPDRLIDDPWAELLAGETGREWIQPKSPESVVPIVLRTRYFDDAIDLANRESGIRQFVLMGAGLDTRAYRLAWPEGTTVFELDLPELLAYKESILHQANAQMRCERVPVSTDMTQEWIPDLLKAGFKEGLSSGWLLEGFLFYLPSLSVVSLLEQVSHLSAKDSWLGFDIINSEMLTSPITRTWIEMQKAAGAPWIGTLDNPEEFLANLGWTANLTQAGQPDANHGRWTLPVIPTTMVNIPHNWFVTARKNP
jgi:methyltransferase (TIGR00027 family)